MSRMTRRVELFPDAEEGFRQVGSPLLENAEYGEEKRGTACRYSVLEARFVL